MSEPSPRTLRDNIFSRISSEERKTINDSYGSSHDDSRCLSSESLMITWIQQGWVFAVVSVIGAAAPTRRHEDDLTGDPNWGGNRRRKPHSRSSMNTIQNTSGDAMVTAERQDMLVVWQAPDHDSVGNLMRGLVDLHDYRLKSASPMKTATLPKWMTPFSRPDTILCCPS